MTVDQQGWGRCTITSSCCAEEAERKLLELGTHDPSLPKPGEILHIDFRADGAGDAASAALSSGRPLRVVQWNIERGYKLDAIVRTLAAVDADVLILQEIDVGCDRSANRDVGASPACSCAGHSVNKRGCRVYGHSSTVCLSCHCLSPLPGASAQVVTTASRQQSLRCGHVSAGCEIAEALSLNYVFLCEFIELRSPKRDRSAQGGGVHGNALLTRLDVTAAEAISHSYHPIDWTAGRHPLTKYAHRLMCPQSCTR